MSKTKQNQTVKLKKVELTNLPNVGVLKVGVAGTKDDKRTNNPGRPVNKKSARYKRLAKQAFYTRVNKSFVSGKSFKLKNQLNDQAYSYRPSKDGGIIICNIGGHVCNIDYIGRTKVTGYTFVLNKRVKVEVNLKNVKFVK